MIKINQNNKLFYEEQQEKKANNRDILYPIAKILSEFNRVQYYVLYNNRTAKLIKAKGSEVNKAKLSGMDIRGFSTSGRPVSYFRNIVVLGSEEAANTYLCYNVSLSGSKEFLMVVKITGEKEVWTRDKAEKFVQAGGNLVGTLMGEDNKLKISSEIEKTFSNEGITGLELGSLEDESILDSDDNIRVIEGMLVAESDEFRARRNME